MKRKCNYRFVLNEGPCKLAGKDEEFTHSRYIEAFTNDIVIGCIHLPTGNPWPAPNSIKS